jgi:hypothetical protein
MDWTISRSLKNQLAAFGSDPNFSPVSLPMLGLFLYSGIT